jgi:hypothetical protein
MHIKKVHNSIILFYLNTFKYLQNRHDERYLFDETLIIRCINIIFVYI